MKDKKGKILKSNRKKKSRKTHEEKTIKGRIVRNLELALLGLNKPLV